MPVAGAGGRCRWPVAKPVAGASAHARGRCQCQWPVAVAGAGGRWPSRWPVPVRMPVAGASASGRWQWPVPVAGGQAGGRWQWPSYLEWNSDSVHIIQSGIEKVDCPACALFASSCPLFVPIRCVFDTVTENNHRMHLTVTSAFIFLKAFTSLRF